LDQYNNPDLLQKYRCNCKFYLHGHSAGGTNPSLVEAMFAGAPVIALENIYNRYTTNNSALYFSNSDELYEIINRINELQLISISDKLKAFAKENYTWLKASGQLIPILFK
jgi:glycosyltransferase involved in cell wall biosynthesis